MEPVDAVAARSHPQVAQGVLVDRTDGRAQVRDERERRGLGSEPGKIPVRAARPHVAGSILEDAPDAVVGEPLPDRVVGDPLVFQAIQSAVARADPEASLPVLADRVDLVAREAAAVAGESDEAAVIETKESARGSDPECALVVPVQDLHPRTDEPDGGAVDARRAGVPPHEPLARADPEAAPRVRDEGGCRRGQLARARRNGEAGDLEAREPAARSHPEIAARVFADCLHEKLREAVLRPEDPDLLAADAREPLVRRRPQDAFAALEELRHDGVGENAARLSFDEGAVLPAQEPGLRADPQRAIAGLAERLDPVVVHRVRIARIEDREPHAVEPREPFLRAEPQVPVPRLQDRVHGVLRQARVAVPDIAPVLRDRRRGVEREAGRRDEPGARRREEEPRGKPPNPADAH